MAQYFAAAPRARCRVGGVLPHRPPAEAAGPGAAVGRLDARGHRPRANGCSANATRWSATARKPRRSILDQLPSSRRGHLHSPHGSRSASCRCGSSIHSTQQAHVIDWVQRLNRWERFMLLKLLTGELRVGVSQTLVVRALRADAGLPATTMAARLMGEWTPTAAWFQALLTPGATDDDRSRPYPFCPGDAARAAIRLGSTRVPGFSPIDSSVARRVEVGRHPRAARASAPARCTCGRAARSSSPSAFPRSSAGGGRCRMAPCSTAKSSRSGTSGRCRSPRCSSASAVRSRSRARRATCRSCSWRTTCSNTRAATSALEPLSYGDRCSKRRSHRPRASLCAANGGADRQVGRARRAAAVRGRGGESDAGYGIAVAAGLVDDRGARLGGAGAAAPRLAAERRRRA